jgi:putative tRNA adenosine deaminase-associated protein
VRAVAYFAALLKRSTDRWQARDADLDEIEDIAGLVEFMREVPDDEEEEEEEPDTTVLLLEQEEHWFAVVRLDAEEDPRVFVSDMAAASRSAYGELLLSFSLTPIGPDGEPEDEADDDEAAAEDEEAPDLEDLAEIEPDERRPLPSGPAGDPLLLEDFDVPAAKLAALCRKGLLPADALAEVAEALGASEELEEVR